MNYFTSEVDEMLIFESEVSLNNLKIRNTVSVILIIEDARIQHPFPRLIRTMLTVVEEEYVGPTP